MVRRRRKKKKIVDTEPISGAELAAILPKAQVHKSRLFYIFLALVLPGFGLHNFYAGYKKRAIIQVLCVFPGIFLIIPFIFCLTQIFVDILTVDKDASGIPFE